MKIYLLSRRSLWAAGAICALAAAPFADAQQARADHHDQASPTSANGLSFEVMDADHDQYISLAEFSKAMTQHEAPEFIGRFSEFDVNADQRLDQQEFTAAQPKLSVLGQPSSTATSANGQTPQTQVEVKAKPAQIGVQSEAPKVTVQPQPPKVIVEQQQPQVSVRQPKAEVTVKQAKPQVDVKTSKPQVEVATTPKPQVTYSTSAADQGWAGMTAADLSNKDVVNKEGDSLGKVSRVVREKSSRNLGVVLSSGGVLEGAGHELFIPLNDLTMQGERLLWTNAVAAQNMHEAQSYQADQYEEIKNQGLKLDVIEQEAPASR